jgi:hypothetical protein
MSNPVPLKDECELVNGIVAWRTSLGDCINGNDYLDFCVPRTKEEMERLCSAANNAFKSFGSKMRVTDHQGTISPTVA